MSGNEITGWRFYISASRFKSGHVTIVFIKKWKRISYLFLYSVRPDLTVILDVLLTNFICYLVVSDTTTCTIWRQCWISQSYVTETLIG